MKFTKSQDGILRATVWYRFRISIDTLALACYFWSEKERPTTRKQILKEIRECRMHDTTDMWDEVNGKDMAKAFKEALTLFPELVTEGNKHYLEEEKPEEEE